MAARRALGYVLGPTLSRVRFPSFPARRASLLRELAIDHVLDVGANIGQYAVQLRLYGYRGAIDSFEPSSAAYQTLAGRAAGDRDWHVHHAGLARASGTATLHVSANSQSSSLLAMLPRHLESAPESAVVGEERVELTTLAHALDAGARTFVKIDAQGSEHAILEGAGARLAEIAGLELELSLVPLYAGETLFPEMVQWLTSRGFALRAVGPGIADPRTGDLLQLDALFSRR